MRLALVFLALAAPALAQEEPNLSATPAPGFGTAAQLVLAQRSWREALATGEVLPMLVAIRLARSVALRPAPGWERTAGAEPAADAPIGREAAPDPASPAALAILQNLAGDDPALQDLVYDLDAQLPRGPLPTATEARATLAPGATDSWRLPLFGEVAAELGLIGDGDTPLALTLMDETGHVLCAHPPATDPQLCRITPQRNGFFTLTVTNPGTTVNSYRLLGN
jgi:hypothetical protein